MERSYNLRDQLPLKKSWAAQSEAVAEKNEQNLSSAVNSSNRDAWMESIKEEVRTIIKNEKWHEESQELPPPDAEVLPSGVILKIKRKIHGSISRFKERLVVRGNLNYYGDGYAALYEPMECIDLVQVRLSISIEKGWKVDQLDVKGAFCMPHFRKMTKYGLNFP